MIIDGWKISDLPKRAAREDYERARTEVIERINKCPGVVAIMDFGTEPYPGISDIDFYIVFDEKAEKMYIPRSTRYSEMTSYLMTHTVLLVSDEHLSELRYLNPWSRYAKEHYIWKSDEYQPRVIEEPVGNTDMLNASFMMDKLDSIFAYMFVYKNKKLPVRHMFEICKNATYCIWRLEDLGIEQKSEYLDFIRRFDRTRETWFELDKEEGVRLLIAHFTEVIKIAFEIIWQLDTWLENRIIKEPKQTIGFKTTKKNPWDKESDNIYCHTFKYSRMYTSSPLSATEAFNLSMQASEKVKISILGLKREQTIMPIILPWNLAAFLATIVSASGILSNEARKDTWVKGKYVPIIKDENFDYKIKIQNELTQKYKDKRVPGGEGKGYIYGNQVFGYLFNEETLLRKLFIKLLRKKFLKNINRVCHL